MSVFDQVLWGSILLAVCTLVHVLAASFMISALPRAARWFQRSAPLIATPLILCFVLALIVISHMLQVGLWAIALIWQGALVGFEPALYFSLVTYATLGYGDIVLDTNYRMFAAFASVTGLLTFGLSTAILVSLFARLFHTNSD